MSYQIRPVQFEEKCPSVVTIVQFVIEQCSQQVTLRKGEFAGQFSISLDFLPDEELDFSINESCVTISGDAGKAPALCEILYTSLIKLGGEPSSELSLLDLPVSVETIDKLNRKARKDLSTLSLFVWLYILVAIFLFCGPIYSLAKWIF